MSRSLLLLLTLSSPPLLAAAGCSGGDCGPGEAPADGVSLEVEGAALTYGAFTSGANNDCPADGHPTSLTIGAEQVAPAAAGFLTLCLPRPDEVGPDPIPLDDDQRVLVVDVGGELEGCRLSIDRTRSLSGTVSFSGFCADGTNPAGYSIDLDATVPGLRSCPTDAGPSDEPVTMTLSGEAAVETL